MPEEPATERLVDREPAEAPGIDIVVGGERNHLHRESPCRLHGGHLLDETRLLEEKEGRGHPGAIDELHVMQLRRVVRILQRGGKITFDTGVP